MNKDIFSYLYADDSKEPTNVCSANDALENARDISSRYSSTCELEICWGMLETEFDELKEESLEK